jgi:hypothetical protein
MKPTTRGRPSKVNNNDITVLDLGVKFLSVKKDNYNNEIAYFKVQDDKFKSKLKPLLSLTDDKELHLPIWKTDKDDYLIKIKTKHMMVPHTTLNNLGHYSVNLEFTNYEFMTKENKMLKGFYSKLVSVIGATKDAEGIESLDELDI